MRARLSTAEASISVTMSRCILPVLVVLAQPLSVKKAVHSSAAATPSLRPEMREETRTMTMLYCPFLARVGRSHCRPKAAAIC